MRKNLSPEVGKEEMKFGSNSQTNSAPVFLRGAPNEPITFAPDPSTHNHCTLGGMIGNNSCGVHSVMGGKTVDNIEEMEILLYDGLRMRVGKTSDSELEHHSRRRTARGDLSEVRSPARQVCGFDSQEVSAHSTASLCPRPI